MAIPGRAASPSVRLSFSELHALVERLRRIRLVLAPYLVAASAGRVSVWEHSVLLSQSRSDVWLFLAAFSLEPDCLFFFLYSTCLHLHSSACYSLIHRRVSFHVGAADVAARKCRLE